MVLIVGIHLGRCENVGPLGAVVVAITLTLTSAGFLSSAAGQDSRPLSPARGAMLMRPDSAGRLRSAPANPVPAARDTEFLENEPPEPRASYGTFVSARESLAVLVLRALGKCARSARSVRGQTTFLYVDRPTLEHTNTGRAFWTIEPRHTSVTAQGLVMTLTTTRSDCPGSEALVDALGDAGWVENAHYGADGPDGTHFAYFCREALCEVEMQWDGGDDSDSTLVPMPGYSLTLTCVPRPREDPAMRRARGFGGAHH